MPSKVVDSSIVAAIAFNEPRADEAGRLLEGNDLYAPRLLSYELTNTAWKKARQHPADVGSIKAGLEWALLMGIHLMDIPHQTVLELALQTSLSAYDASYLYLARTLGADLVTFDEELATAASQSSS